MDTKLNSVENGVGFTMLICEASAFDSTFAMLYPIYPYQTAA